MSEEVHVMHEFWTANADTIFDRCDALMEELLDREAKDGSVHDAAVSADKSKGLVVVEVLAEGGTFEDASQAGVRRIVDAVESVTERET